MLINAMLQTAVPCQKQAAPLVLQQAVRTGQSGVEELPASQFSAASCSHLQVAPRTLPGAAGDGQVVNCKQ